MLIKRHYLRRVKRYIRRYPVAYPSRRVYDPSIQKAKLVKQKLCLLIAAHNEEVVIAGTLRSAIAAGMKPANIYVVDDNSSDKTSRIAKEIIPPANVIKVGRSGKGLALTKGADRFKLTQRYRWIHIADADGAFAPDYFYIFRRSLRVKYAAATGYVRSLPGKRISEYRVFEYTVGMEIHRRLQVMLQVVPVIPGPTSCFRADVFSNVNFANHSLTEDFDVTMQLHRKRLGKVQFIPEAVAYTQDPRNLKDYTKQITRWNRGGLQSMLKYKIGRRPARIDAYLTYQILQNLLFFASYFLWVPYLAIARHQPSVIASAFVVDVGITFIINLLVAMRSGRLDVIGAFPQIYLLRWVSLGIFLRAFIEVVILRKFRNTDGLWDNTGRRYLMSTD